MNQPAWIKNYKGVKEQMTVVGPAKRFSDYAPAPQGTPGGGIVLELPMTMYGAKIEPTGAGEDGIVQPDKPVDMVVTDGGPKMLHEGEYKIVAPDGSMAVIPAKMIPQEMLASFEKQSGTGGYEEGVGLHFPTPRELAGSGNMVTVGFNQPDKNPIFDPVDPPPPPPPPPPPEPQPSRSQGAYDASLETLQGIATGSSNAFRTIANRRLDDQAARNQWAGRAAEQTIAQSPTLTAGGKDAMRAGIIENQNANMSAIQGDLAVNAENAAQSAAGTLGSLASSGLTRENQEKWDAYNAAMNAGDTARAAEIYGTITGGPAMNMSEANSDLVDSHLESVAAAAATHPGARWQDVPSVVQDLQQAWDLAHPDKAGQYDSPEFTAFADDEWNTGQQTPGQLALRQIEADPMFQALPEDDTDTNNDGIADTGPLAGQPTKGSIRRILGAAWELQVTGGADWGFNEDNSFWMTQNDAEGNPEVIYGHKDGEGDPPAPPSQNANYLTFADTYNTETGETAPDNDTWQRISAVVGHPATVSETQRLLRYADPTSVANLSQEEVIAAIRDPAASILLRRSGVDMAPTFRVSTAGGNGERGTFGGGPERSNFRNVPAMNHMFVLPMPGYEGIWYRSGNVTTIEDRLDPDFQYFAITNARTGEVVYVKSTRDGNFTIQTSRPTTDGNR